MMTHDICGGLLSAYIDGELDATVRGDVEGHLRSCHACRTSAQELAAVRDCLSTEPFESLNGPPPWAGIQRSLVRQDVRSNVRRAVVRSLAAVAAAVVLIAITRDLIDRRGEPVGRPTMGPGADRTDGADGATSVAARDLEQFIQANSGRLTPAMNAASGQIIEVLNRAIGEVRLSLSRDPEDPFLALYLTRLERQRLAAMRSLAATVRGES